MAAQSVASFPCRLEMIVSLCWTEAEKATKKTLIAPSYNF